MIEEKRDTVGQIITDLASKPQDVIEIGDISKQEEERYIAALNQAIERGLKKYEKDFFIEVAIKKERLFANMFPRIYAIERFTCPTPFYSQDVFHYKRKDAAVDYLWSVPDLDICDYLKTNANALEGPERDLLRFTQAFDEGKLLLICNELNGEEPKSLDLKKPSTIRMFT